MSKMGYQKFCIYRVPSQLRDVKPEAYTPRSLLIGPLHHSAKPKIIRKDSKKKSDIEANILMEDLKNGNSRYINTYTHMAVSFLLLLWEKCRNNSQLLKQSLKKH